MLRKCMKKIKEVFQKILFYLKLAKMDFHWNMHRCGCFDPFPPSFYYTHTDEEIDQIIEELRAYIEELKRENEALEQEETS